MTQTKQPPANPGRFSSGAGVIDLQFNAIAGSHRGVIVDLSRVSFLASIGIRTLLLGAKAVQRRGGVLVLLNPVIEVAKVLDLMGVIDLMPIYRDPDAALSAGREQISASTCNEATWHGSSQIGASRAKKKPPHSMRGGEFSTGELLRHARKSARDAAPA